VGAGKQQVRLLTQHDGYEITGTAFAVPVLFLKGKGNAGLQTYLENACLLGRIG